jgi:DNA-binding CsgD family transcriptional regulator
VDPLVFDALVRGLYQSAAGRQPWEDVIQDMVDALSCMGCHIVGMNKLTGEVALSLYGRDSPMEAVLDYVREFHRIDPHAAHALTLPPMTVFNGADLISERQARAHPFYTEFWSAYNMRHFTGGKLTESADLVTLFGFFRTPEQGPFSASQHLVVERLARHLADALDIFKSFTQLRTGTRLGAVLIDRIPRPAMLLDARRRLLHANSSGQNLLKAGDCLVLRKSVLNGVKLEAQASLCRAMADLGIELQDRAAPDNAELPGRRAVSLAKDDGSFQPACLWALLPETTMGTFGSSPCVLLILPLPSCETAIDPVVVEAAFNLTPAEGRVVAGLATFADPRQAAKHLGVSLHTVRTHLKNIFEKTGLRSQKELLLAAHSIMSF